MNQPVRWSLQKRWLIIGLFYGSVYFPMKIQHPKHMESGKYKAPKV